MAKRTSPPKATAADLHTSPVSDAVAMHASYPQPLPPVVKSSGKPKAKAKPNTVRDDDPLAADPDTTITVASEHSLPDSGHDVLLAQASTSSSAPASVGEDLLRQAGPVNSKSSVDAAGGLTDFLPKGWGMPLAIGGGVLAVAAATAGGGGGGNSSPPTPSTSPESNTDTTPQTYALSITPMAGKFTEGGIAVDIYKNGALWKALSTTDGNSQFADGKFTLTVNRNDLHAGDVLQLVLRDTNGDANNYKDEFFSQKASLGEANTLHAWLTVPGAITDTGTLSLAITPLTELAHRNMGSPEPDTVLPSTESNNKINGANNAVARAFGLQQDGLDVDLVQTVPVATNDGAFNNSDDVNAQAYGRALATISSLALKNNAVSSEHAPSESALTTALQQLEDVNHNTTLGTYALSEDAKTQLSEAVISYNKNSASAAAKLPGIALDETEGLDSSVSLYDYDTNGLGFKLYAPADKKAGDTVTLKFQAYNADGSLDTSKSFNVEYTLQSTVAPTSKAYSGETVSLPRLVNNPNDETQIGPKTDSQGNTLLGIASAWEDGLLHYRVSIEGVNTLGSYQDFKLNPSPIHIANTSDSTPQGYVKKGDTVQVDVVLDQDVLWGVDTAAPTLTIHYVGSDGISHEKTSQLLEASGKGHVLSFTFEFNDADANGTITLTSSALTGEVCDAYGNPLEDYLASVKTEVSDSHLIADTTLPPSALLSVGEADGLIVNKDVVYDGESHKADFVNTTTPTLKVSFKGEGEAAVASDTLPQTETQVTVQLFAYIDQPRESDKAIASIALKPGDEAIFTPDDYTPDWRKTSLDADGQAYKFYAKVIDAAGNESSSNELSLWLDDKPPAAPTVAFNANQDNTYDTEATDNSTRDTTPSLHVTGEAGSKVELYEVNADGSKSLLASIADVEANAEVKTPGHVGDSDSAVDISPNDNLKEGTHVLVAKLTDAAGNSSDYSAPVTVVIDTTSVSASTLTIENPPENGYYRSGDTIDISARFDEAVYLPSGATSPTLSFQSGGHTVVATLKTGEASGLGTNILHFSYLVTRDAHVDSGAAGQIEFSADTVQIYDKESLVDHVGNPTTSPLSLKVTDPRHLQIDTTPPGDPTVAMASADLGLVSLNEAKATTGLVNVTAEAGTHVDVTFSATAGGVTKTVTKPINAASGSGNMVALTADDLNALGVANTPSATIQVTAKATDAAGNEGDPSGVLSFTLDTVAPTVSAASVASGSPAVIGHRTPDSINSVNFTVTFSEPFASGVTLTKDHFSIVDGLGTINSVSRNESTNIYTVNATPVDNQQGTMVLSLVANGGGVQLKDDAGNWLISTPLNTAGLAAQQAFDTQAPQVIHVTDDTTETVTHKATLKFTVEFSEPTKTLGNVKNSFSVTHGTVTDVQADTTTGSASAGYTKYIVTVQTESGLPSGTVELSLQKSEAGGFVDAHNNTVSIPDGGVSLVDVGGQQEIDTTPPGDPTVAMASADLGLVSLNEAKATTGLVNVTAEAGTHVDVTFSATAGGVTKTVTKPINAASGSGNMVALTADDLNALGVANTPSATIQVTAKATDAAGNEGDPSGVLSFTLDTEAPTVTTVSGPQGATSGPASISFIVTLSEELGTDLTQDNFTLKNSDLGTVESVTKSSETGAYTVVVTPAKGQTGDIALMLHGLGVADVAGNPLVDADLSGLHKQAINTVAPRVLSVTDDFTDEYANANSTITYTVTFDKALNTAGMGADALKAAFTDANGEVQSVTTSDNTVYVVRVTPTANRSDAVMSLNIVADKLSDALGNKVEAASLSSFDSQKIDTQVPSAPTSFQLNSASDTGTLGDGYTSVNVPKFDLQGLETGSTVTIYNDKNNNAKYDSGDDLLWRGIATGTSMTTTAITSALGDGSYPNIRVSQTDVHGNLGQSLGLSELIIQSQPPAKLSNLVFDSYQDTHNAIGAELPTGSRDYRTNTPVPKFEFQGGTVNSTAVLFLDKNNNSAFDDGEELGRAKIEEAVTHNISVDPLHALSQGTYGPSSSKGQIGILEINAAGVHGAVSMLSLSPENNDSGRPITGLTISPAAPQSIVIESSQFSGPTHQDSLTFHLSSGGQLGGTITVTADAVDAVTEESLGSAVSLGTVNSPNGSGDITMDVSRLATTGHPIKYTNFQAHQSYAGVNSSIANVSFTGGSTAKTDGIIIDHVAPTVEISADKTLLLEGEVAQLTFTFSEKITGFTADDIDGLGGGQVTAPSSADGGKTWTVTYTPALNSTTPVSLSLKVGAVTDAAANQNQGLSPSLALGINTQTQEAPVTSVPDTDPTEAISAVVGSPYAISGVHVEDTNNDLSMVTLHVDHGTLSISTTNGVTITGSGTTDSPLTLTVNAGVTGEAATTAINDALGKLMFTASDTTLTTLTITSTDTAIGGNAAHSDTATRTLSVITAAPAAPVNEVPASLDTTSSAIVAGQSFNFKESSDSNTLRVSDINNDLTQVELHVDHGTLGISATDGVTIMGSGTTDNPLKLTVNADVTGEAATTAINAALEKLSYTADGTAAISDTLTIKTTDANSTSDTDTVTLTVNATPNAPVNHLPDSLTGVLTGQPKDISGIRVSDDDSNLAFVTLTVGHGNLQVSSESDAVTVENNNSNSITLRGSDSSRLNAALATLSYTASSSYTGDDSLTVETSDSTANNLGGAKTTSNTLSFQVLAAPVNTLSAPSDVKGGGDFSLSGLSVDDADDNITSVTLQVSEGVLSTTGEASGATASDSGHVLTFTGSKSDINAALATVSYNYADQHGKSGISLTMTSIDSSSPEGLTDVDTVTFNVGPADNDLPESHSVSITSNTGLYDVGATLTADTSALNDTNDTNGVDSAFVYEWTRTTTGDAPVTTVVGSNSPSYTVTGADAGATVSVKVSYTDGAGYEETNASIPTTTITWPSSLALNNLNSSDVSLSFYDDPDTDSHPQVLSTNPQAQFMGVQQGKYYVLDVNGDGHITSEDKTTYASGLAEDGTITTASGVTLQLLSSSDWSSFMTANGGSVPNSWFGESDLNNTVDYWTRDAVSNSTHRVYTPSTNSSKEVANDATAFVPSPYHYNVFQVIG